MAAWGNNNDIGKRTNFFRVATTNPGSALVPPSNVREVITGTPWERDVKGDRGPRPERNKDGRSCKDIQ